MDVRAHFCQGSSESQVCKTLYIFTNDLQTSMSQSNLRVKRAIKHLIVSGRDCLNIDASALNAPNQAHGYSCKVSRIVSHLVLNNASHSIRHIQGVSIFLLEAADCPPARPCDLLHVDVKASSILSNLVLFEFHDQVNVAGFGLRTREHTTRRGRIRWSIRSANQALVSYDARIDRICIY